MKTLILTLLALWALHTPAAAAFSDVPPEHWAAAAVEQCVARGWFQGRSETYFGVEEPMSRSAFAVVLCRFFGWQPSAVFYPIFSDVPQGAWYEPSLRACYEQGAIPRQTDTFRPAEALTRQDLAAMLIRSLGLGPIAGLAAEEETPFRDLYANRGHISMACALGLLKGVGAERFYPEGQATRGQVAAVLLRLEEKRSLPLQEALVLIEPRDTWPELPEGAVAVCMTGVLSGGEGPRLTISTESGALTAGQRRAQEAGRTVLLGVTGSSGVLRSAAAAAAALAAAVQEGGYDGLYLDLRQGQESLEQLALLAQALRSQMPRGRLYLVADGPVEGAETGGYAAIAAEVDRLVVRIEAQRDFDAAVAVSAMETPERLYDTLRLLTRQVSADKLSLLLTAQAAAVRGRRVSALSGGEVERLRTAGAVEHYSDRYACAYLQNKETTVWYLEGRGLAERRLLLGCFGVSSVCLSSLRGTVSLGELLAEGK